eukprot:8608871-Pyramimonas_sp.AAC.1
MLVIHIAIKAKKSKNPPVARIFRPERARVAWWGPVARAGGDAGTCRALGKPTCHRKVRLSQFTTEDFAFYSKF